MVMVVPLIIIFFLLFVSAFFSAGETAMTGVSQPRMLAAEKDGNRLAKLVNRILDRKDRMIGAMLLGNNAINILASAIMTNVFINMFGDTGVFYATGIMTVLVLIFAEVLPKTLALHRPERIAMFMAPVMRVVIIILSPFVQLISSIVHWTLKVCGVDITSVDEEAQVEVLRGAIEMHRGPEQETQKQRAMLKSVMDLADVTVEEVMIHRKNVAMLDATKDSEEIINEVLNSPYTRMPVWKDKPDNIIGIIHVKWLLRELKGANNDYSKIQIENIAADPWFIPNTTTLFDQLQAFRERGEHFAFVVDEYGSFMGVVTLEDILEDIVGDIDDEHDMSVPGVKKQPNSSFLVNGTVTIRDLKREFEWDLPDEDYTTLAGLVLYESQRLPDVGQSFLFHGFRFDVVRRHRNQITLLRVVPPAPEITDEASSK